MSKVVNEANESLDLADEDMDEGILSMVRGAASALAEFHRSATDETYDKFTAETKALYKRVEAIKNEGDRLAFVRTLTEQQQEDLQEYTAYLVEESTKNINGGDPMPTALPGNNNRPEVAFDEHWFSDNCKDQPDPTRFTKYYKDQQWQKFKKCENEMGAAKEFSVENQEACEAECTKVADEDPTSTFCCEFDSTPPGKCSVVKGFSNMRDSKKGKMWKPFSSDAPKFSKYVKSSKKRPIEDDMDEEFDGMQQNSKFMRRLVEQVNHMSIDGIIRHLLSFYVCMRWVPDEQYINLAKYEFQNVDVDSSTKRDASVTDDDMIKAYINFDAVPLKCSTGMDVQDLGMIDTLLEEFRDQESPIHEAYEFSEDVASQSNGFLGTTKWFGSVDDTKKRVENPVEVAEMADKAHSVLPWDGFIRPSQQYTWGMGMKWGTHVSKAKNLFFVCFGPRVSSFPHKRENGPSFLADMNMAGCNGLWDMKDVINHIDRIRQLFAPETCLTDDLRRKLKQTFLETFVEMNQGFEKKITGNMFSGGYQGVNTIPDELRDATPAYLSSIDPNQPDFLGERKASKKYQRMGRLVSGAHTKWVVCTARKPETPAVGLASSFFNSPTAYKKWFDGAFVNEKNLPECKTFDPYTGCMKCVIAVRSHPYRCLMRLGLTFEQIMDAVKQNVEPMVSRYDSVMIKDILNDKGQVTGHKKVLERERGVCIVQKDSRNRERNTDRDKFRSVGESDRVVHVTSSKVDGMGFTVQDRYGLPDRREKLADLVKTGGVQEKEKTEEERLAEAVNRLMTEGEQTHAPKERFGPRMTFSEVIHSENNVVPHEVDYFVTCPCEEDDFSQLNRHKDDGINGMGDYLVGL